MSSIASIYKAVSGLSANERALHVTAHNLSNVNTPGFVRQQALYRESNYVKVGFNGTNIQKVGLGVELNTVRQVRDMFLDKAYRTELGREGFYRAQYESVQEIEEIFGEIEGTTFAQILDDLWSSISELSGHPEGLETRGTFVQSAIMFVNRSEMIMNQLRDFQVNMNTQIIDIVKEINTLGDTINDLNNRINRAEASGEKANDYRDLRNNALDRLAQLVDISYREDATGRVSVSVEGKLFVSDGRVSYINLEQAEPMSPLVKPVWDDYKCDLFDFNKPINTENGNDIGLLKGLLITRGTKETNYTDMNPPADYEKNVKPSIAMNLMAQFDQLVHGVVTMINDILCPNVAGQLDITNAPYGLDNSQGTEIFKRKSVNRYDGTGTYNVEDKTNTYSLYSAGNIVINPEILKDYNKIALSRDKLILGDNTVINEILTKWHEPFAKLDPRASATLNFNEYYANYVSEMGYRGQVTKNISDNQKIMTDQINNQRNQLTGVSTDEELGNMMRYQHAYNASAKVVNVLDSMIEHIIERVGIVGR